jgi:3',5'-cyclic AMP phosphodiesterase CpdA
MLIAQISDCHVTEPSVLAYGRVDTAACLRLAVAAIQALPAKPDLLLVTGDLVQSGKVGEYEVFLEAVAEVGAPILPVAGNHDAREHLAEVFGLRRRFDLQSGFVQYVQDDHPLRVIVLDSTTPGSAEPSYCPPRLDWLAARLAESRQPTLIAMHHPPFPAGVAWMEPRDPDWAAPLATLLAGHPNVVRLVCGHVHRSMTTAWGGVVAMSAPSTAHQVFLDLATSDRRFSFEAPGFLLHRWTQGRLSSYGAAVPGLGDVFDFGAPLKRTD